MNSRIIQQNLPPQLPPQSHHKRAQPFLGRRVELVLTVKVVAEELATEGTIDAVLNLDIVGVAFVRVDSRPPVDLNGLSGMRQRSTVSQIGQYPFVSPKASRVPWQTRPQSARKHENERISASKRAFERLATLVVTELRELGRRHQRGETGYDRRRCTCGNLLERWEALT